ncbi:LysM peptidoglycan-binding domain-containing protein [Halalkalibacillus halophilus]|uniref:C40 family peptidase n=1 Tax=Halalkalibacillus halophilus TaxID=392827 RepID=UPI000683DE4A|nr:LysM peptidoglycan-binding domain-containing protein [Halalkalibacillus halophilus]
MALTTGLVVAGQTYAHADESYTVESGDSLWKISQDFDASVQELKSFNNLSSNIIHPGQTITVSEGSTSNNSTSNTNSDAAVHTVQSGDTLSGIASDNNTSVSSIMSLNDLSNHLIYPGQSLTLSGNGSNDSNVEEENTDIQTSTHTVQSGDTLSQLASDYGTTVSSLKTLNNLSSNLIIVGQSLTVNEDADESSSQPDNSSPDETTTSSAESLIDEAMQHIGAPYAWGGTSPAGFDCSGFLNYVFNQEGIDLPRTVSGIWAGGNDAGTPSRGDIVFFETYTAGPSHAGIYLGNGEFVHAGSNGVTIGDMNNSYWAPKYLGAKSY